ncbi:MAG: Gfo/Idh/MocA family protein [Pseudomarimonas sp.]
MLGCGLWGSNILRDLLALGAVVQVVETDAAARARALQAGAHAVASSPLADGRVDGWIVATPARSHRECIEQLASCQLPILCEKPLTSSIADAVAIVACVRGPLHVMDVWRYHPAVEQMQHWVASGELGAVQGLRSTRANWISPRLDVDTAWNLAPHEISIFHHLFGHYPLPQSAFAECIEGQARSVWSRWGKQPWLVSELSNRHPNRSRQLRLHAEAGVAVFDGEQPDVIEIAAGPADARLEASERRRVHIGNDSALRRQLAAWLGFLNGGPPPRSDLAHAVRVVELVAQMRGLAGLPA